MGKSMIMLVGGIVLLFVALVVLYFSFPKKGYDNNIEIIEISSPNNSSKLFIKKKTWGMTGDGQVIVVSNEGNNIFEPDSTSEYIFKGLSPFLYKVEKDTLVLYVYQASQVPANLKSDFVVRQVELENSEMMKLMENDNYKQQGLIIVK